MTCCGGWGRAVKSTVDEGDKEQGRQTLLAIVEQAIARLAGDSQRARRTRTRR